MKTFFLAFGLSAALAMPGLSSPRTSADYLITSETTGAAGAAASSTSYSISGSTVSEFGTGSATVASTGDYTVKPGFAGRLYEIVGLALSASSLELNERASRAINAAPSLDDATTLTALDPTKVAWSVLRGPIVALSADGIATAGTVFQDSAAEVAGEADGRSGNLDLLVLNLNPDDFGIYASDQINDDWQVQYFGEENPMAGPNVDADGTGHRNLFKFTAGLHPLDGSRFTLRIEPVANQPSHKRLIFHPVVAGRSYTVEATSTLVHGTWSPLGAQTVSDAGAARTITDLNGSPAPKFYRVKISRP